MAFCDWCRREFIPIREGHRFCSVECHDNSHIDERRRALAAWRAQQRMASFFGSAIQPTADEMDKDNPLRRTG
jgi:hypothetical protein